MGEPETNARWRPGAGPATPTIDDDRVVIELQDDGVVLDLDASAPFSGPTHSLTDPDATQRYADWAERMRAKRRRDQAHILGTDPLGPGGQSGRAHWASDTVFGSDTTTHTGPAPLFPGSSDPLRCLGVLGLDPSATVDEVAAAYRQLAKLHHPDRWAEAAPEIQLEHSEQMLRVNAAYHALRSQLPA